MDIHDNRLFIRLHVYFQILVNNGHVLTQISLATVGRKTTFSFGCPLASSRFPM
jgi:hypothetical protein